MNYDEKRAALIEYLKMKTQEADWHAVSDVANDLRVFEAIGPAETEPMKVCSPAMVDNRKPLLGSQKYSESPLTIHQWPYTSERI